MRLKCSIDFFQDWFISGQLGLVESIGKIDLCIINYINQLSIYFESYPLKSFSPWLTYLNQSFSSTRGHILLFKWWSLARLVTVSFLFITATMFIDGAWHAADTLNNLYLNKSLISLCLLSKAFLYLAIWLCPCLPHIPHSNQAFIMSTLWALCKAAMAYNMTLLA